MFCARHRSVRFLRVCCSPARQYSAGVPSRALVVCCDGLSLPILCHSNARAEFGSISAQHCWVQFLRV